MFATLDGEILSDAAWSFTVGTSPYVARIEVPAEVAARLASTATIYGSVLVIEDDNLERVEVEGLTILGAAPTASPFTLAVIVADRRWAWNRTHVHRRYNMRRRSGAVRRVDSGGKTPRQTKNLAADIEYAPWSLRQGREVWTPEEILGQVMDRVAGEDNWRAKDDVLVRQESLPGVENLEVTGPGDAAIAQVLAAVGGVVSIYVGANGKAVLFDRLSDKERGLVGAPIRPGVGGITLLKDTPERVPLITDAPVWTLADRRMERPSAVRVLFDRAIELRMDFDDQDTVEVAAAKRSLGATETGPVPALLENVLQLPEDISDELINTTWVTVQRYLQFLEGKTLNKLPDLTLEGLNEKWLSSALNVYADPTVDPSGLWARRIAPFRQHYRRTFRLKRPWIDRISDMVASRVAIQDQESHARAQAPVFQDYAEWVTWRHGTTEGRTANDGPDVDSIVRNRFARALPKGANVGSRTIIDADIRDLAPAPAVVRILDKDQGLFQVGFVFDFEGESVRYTRSAVKGLNAPSENVRDNSILLQWGELRDKFQLATVVTVAPASPNDNRRLHAEEVTHQDASALLPGRGVASADEVALGPVYEVKVSKIPARFGWEDGEVAQNLYTAFAVAQEGVPDLALGPLGVTEFDLSPLFGVPINQDELETYAKAVAASIYSGFRDRVIGGLTTSLAPGLEPEGTAQVVTHAATMGPGGGALTTVDLPEDVEKRDPVSLLPASLRRLVDRFVDL